MSELIGPNNQPLPRCIAWHCGELLAPLGVNLGAGVYIAGLMCKSHWENVPGHIRNALSGEWRAMRQAGLIGPGKQTPMTPALQMLMNIACAKEIEARAKADPKIAEALTKEFEAFQEAQRAAQSPIAIAATMPGKPVPQGPLIAPPGAPPVPGAAPR